jgi:hypothetical protein
MGHFRCAAPELLFLSNHQQVIKIKESQISSLFLFLLQELFLQSLHTGACWKQTKTRSDITVC